MEHTDKKILMDFDKKTHEGEDFMEVFKSLALSFEGINESLKIFVEKEMNK